MVEVQVHKRLDILAMDADSPRPADQDLLDTTELAEIAAVAHPPILVHGLRAQDL